MNNFAVTLRFNFNELKRKCDLSEIFDVPPEDKIEIPKEWLDRITVGYSSVVTYGGGARGSVNSHHHGAHYMGMSSEDAMALAGVGSGYASLASLAGVGSDMEDSGAKKADASVGKNEMQLKGLNSKKFKLRRRAGAGSQNGAVVTRNQSTGSIEVESAVSGTAQGKEFLDYLTVNHGEKVANGYDQVASGIMELESTDDLLRSVFREIADRMSPDGKQSLNLPRIIPAEDNILRNLGDESNLQFRNYMVVQYGDEIVSGLDQIISGLEDIGSCDEALKEALMETIVRMDDSSPTLIGL